MPRVFIFIPPLPRVTGGVQVLLRLGESLRRAGADCLLAVRDPLWKAPDLGPGRDELPHVACDQAQARPGDFWIVPEGWPSGLALGLAARARVVLYCQNWAYLLGNLPGELTRTPSAISWLAVSHPVAWLMEYALGIVPEILRPGIDLDLFCPPGPGPFAGKALPGQADPVTIAFMPRKNKALAAQVREITSARQAGSRLDWLEIKDMTRAQVAAALRRAHIFLATGFPEGCPLPPLEAMACGCLPVGFSGFGGLDYMRQVFAEDYRHWLAPEPREFGGNALLAADADTVGAACLLSRAIRLWRRADPLLEGALVQGQATARAYGESVFDQAVADLWARRFGAKD